MHSIEALLRASVACICIHSYRHCMDTYAFNRSSLYNVLTVHLHSYAWVVSNTRMSHVAHMNRSCHIYEWVMSHTSMSHVAHINESWHIYVYYTSACRCVRCIVYIYVPWLIYMCDMTHSCMRRDMTHSYMWHDHIYVYYTSNAYKCATPAYKCATWLNHKWNKSRITSVHFTLYIVASTPTICMSFHSFVPKDHTFSYLHKFRLCRLL